MAASLQRESNLIPVSPDDKHCRKRGEVAEKS